MSRMSSCTFSENVFFQKNGFGEYAESFKKHKVNGNLLLKMNERDLKNPIGITVLGDLKALWEKIEELQDLAFSIFEEEDLHNTWRFGDRASFSKMVFSLVYLFLSVFVTSLTVISFQA